MVEARARRAKRRGDDRIAAVLACQDGRRANVNNLYRRIGEALRDVEREYGLRVLSCDKAADESPAQRERPGRDAQGSLRRFRAKLRRIAGCGGLPCALKAAWRERHAGVR